ncbi:MAG: hypothetical protein H6832_19110 [Planctomycetes bacterium]|nr:hypothetical protein [Planctomycetota bacterium]
MPKLSHYCTAFIDLLGLSNKLDELGRIIPGGMEKKEATPFVRASIGAILNMRQRLEQWLADFDDPERQARMLDSLPPAMQEDYRAAQAGKATVQWFTDCAYINSSVDLSSPLAAIRGLLSQFAGIASAQLLLLLEGQRLRGGIETGFAMDLGSGEIIGSGSTSAYRLESTVALYPRVVVGSRLWTLLEEMQTPGSFEEFTNDKRLAAVAREQSKYLRGFIRLDFDDLPVIDPVSPQILRSMAREPFELDFGTPLENLQPELDESYSKGDLKLYQKLKYAEKVLDRGDATWMELSASLAQPDTEGAADASG